MPRPCKRRRVCAEPLCRGFGPPDRDAQGTVAMALEEFEAIRLIDFEGMTQEECAAQMDVARTTVQAIYAAARKKLAECLVLGRQLVISGGEYELCRQDAPFAGCERRCRCCRHKNAGPEGQAGGTPG